MPGFSVLVFFGGSLPSLRRGCRPAIIYHIERDLCAAFGEINPQCSGNDTLLSSDSP